MFALTVVLLLSCDPRAVRIGGDEKAPSQVSREFESCASSADCQSGFACLGNWCANQKRLAQGDYYVAMARVAAEGHDFAAAIAHYRNAVEQYRAANLKPPTELFCAQASAMVELRADESLAEEAAKILHARCLNAVPAGSALYHRALHSFTLLAEVGFDPVHLGQREPADRYLTGRPSAPSVENVKLEVDGNVKTRAANYRKFIDHLRKTESVRSSLLPCWKQNLAATKEARMIVIFRIRSRFVEAYDEADDAYHLSIVDGKDSAKDPAYACAKAVLVPILKSQRQRRGGKWNGEIAISLGS